MADLTLHRTIGGGYWVGVTGLWLLKKDDGWKFTWPLGLCPQMTSWIEHNPDIGERCFTTRRDAMALITALDAVDPLPADEAWYVPPTSIRSKGPGRYEVQDLQGAWQQIIRKDDGHWYRAGSEWPGMSYKSLWFAALSVRNRP